MIELDEFIQNDDILLLSETQLKYDRVKCFNENICRIDSMRDKEDKKGGGLAIMFHKDSQHNIFKIETKNKDIMNIVVEDKAGVKRLTIILVYMSVNNGKKDRERNVCNKKDIENLLNQSNECVMVIGDFNGHIEKLGYQKEDSNGKIVMKIKEKYGLEMLNLHDICHGVYTWQRGTQKSVIDFVLGDDKLVSLVEKMIIDEEHDIYDHSDHNMIELKVKWGTRQNKWQKKYVSYEYCSKKEEDINDYVKSMEEICSRNNITDISMFNNGIKEAADNNLKKIIRKRVDMNDQHEKPWFTKELKEIMEKKKYYNRLKRRTKEEEHVEKFEFYKKLLSEKIQEEMINYEKKLVKELKNNKGNSKKQWEYMKKLSKNDKQNKHISIYEKDGKMITDIEEERYNFETEWKRILQKEDNLINNVWDENTGKQYQENLDEKRISLTKLDNCRVEKETGIMTAKVHTVNIPNHLVEHFDMAYKIPDRPVNPMKEMKIEMEDLKRNLKKIKNNKACGPDGIKNEMYKYLVDSPKCLETLEYCFEKELNCTNKPDSWKKSLTKMIPKETKPTVDQFRPIALTDSSYKIFTAMIKEKIEEHLFKSQVMNECQSGFTEKRRLEDNLFILNEGREEAYRKKKMMVVVSIDFCKAYDSVTRKMIIDTLKFFKIDYKVINIIAEIYSGDSTKLKVRDDLEIELNINNGIRQGCNLSPTLFKMITFRIMEEMQLKCKGFQVHGAKINTLFYADDGLIIEESIEEAEKSVEKLIVASKLYGLKINMDKSKALIFNSKQKPEHIGKIKVVEEIKYLGMKISNKKQMFEGHKCSMFAKARKFENMTYGMVEKGCSRMMIGKTYWKQVGLSSILHGASIIDFTESEIRSLQTSENNVYRKILKAPFYTPVCVLRGDVGSSMMKTRIMRDKILYWKSIFSRNNELLKVIADNPRCRLSTKVKKYLETLEISENEVRTKSEGWIRKKIDEFDTMEWRKELEKKKSVQMYKESKTEIKEINLINRASSFFGFRLRSNTVGLNDRKRFMEGDVKCSMCGYEREDIIHFVVDCPVLQDVRKQIFELQWPQDDKEKYDISKEVIFDSTNEYILYQMYRLRKQLMESCDNK